jgi:phosphatidylserine/phosphatidylglycerophosphate/cardiolipin synthase-like enzyme
MDEVFDCMKAAKQAILFLVFQPGSPSIVQTAAECLDANPDLFLRGAATDPSVQKEFLDTVELFHGSTEPDLVVPATAVTDQFSYWERELLKSSPKAHAIIHDKIVVIDPFSDGCVVITGSHNLGFRASYNNDENLLIIRGNHSLAAAYTVHVMDVYDHYRWRFTLEDSGNRKAWSGLEKTDGWQDKYFRNGVVDAPELHFWLGKP